MWFAWRKDKRETAAASVPAPPPSQEPPQAPPPQNEIGRWCLDLPEPRSPVEWRLAELSRRHDVGAARAYLRRVNLLGPVGARLAPGDPNSPGAAWGLFHYPDTGKGGGSVVFEAEMPDAMPMLEFIKPFPGSDYARVQFFVAMPMRDAGTAPPRLEIEILAEEAAGERREIRLHMSSCPIV